MAHHDSFLAFNWYRHLMESNREGPGIEACIEEQLRRGPRYVALCAKLLERQLELQAVVPERAWPLYLRAEEIHNEHASLLEESAFNVGFVTGIAHARAGEDPSTTALAVRLLACIAEAELGTAARSRALLAALHALHESHQVE